MLKWLKAHTIWVKYFLLGTALIAVYKTFDNLDGLWSGIRFVLSALTPFIFAFVIAYMLNIPTVRIKALIDKKAKNPFIKKYSNPLSIAGVYVIFISVIVLIIGSVIPAITKEIADILGNIDVYAKNIEDFVNNIDFLKTRGIGIKNIDFELWLTNIFDKFLSADMLNYTKSITSGIASGFMNVFIGLIASVYMLIDKERILKSVKRLAGIFKKDKGADSFLLGFSRVNEVFTQYIYSRLTCCVVMAIACTLVLVIMGEKYALLLGIFIGFMDLIPYFGSIISWFAGFFVMAISGGFSHAIWTSLVILVLQQLDGNVLAPRVMSSRLEIRPLAIIIAVSVGGSLFGFVGMFLSVPVVTILKAVLSETIKEKLPKESADK